ncbi:MAG: hypothetical protein Q9173_007254, partial [Seirophora scorigena]
DAFKDLAKVSRWRLLALSGWDDGEKALLAQIAKWTAVLKLGAKSRAKRWLFWACASWGAQNSVALITQVYSLQDGTNWKGTYTRADKVNTADLSCYYHHHYEEQTYTCESSPETVHGIAHAYGLYAFGSLTPGNDCVPYNDIDDVLRSQTTPKYYCRRTPGRREFAYRFLEYNPDDTERTYPRLTDRTITASAGQCQQYSFVKVESVTTKSGKWSNYTYENGDINGSILLPVAVDTFYGTVYTYRGVKTPEEAKTYACGDRCILMWAHATGTGNGDSLFYQCPVTINEVRNAQLPAHEVSPGIARLAAASIGLQGGKSDAVNGWAQSSFFPIS